MVSAGVARVLVSPVAACAWGGEVWDCGARDSGARGGGPGGCGSGGGDAGGGGVVGCGAGGGDGKGGGAGGCSRSLALSAPGAGLGSSGAGPASGTGAASACKGMGVTAPVGAPSIRAGGGVLRNLAAHWGSCPRQPALADDESPISVRHLVNCCWSQPCLVGTSAAISVGRSREKRCFSPPTLAGSLVSLVRRGDQRSLSPPDRPSHSELLVRQRESWPCSPPLLTGCAAPSVAPGGTVPGAAGGREDWSNPNAGARAGVAAGGVSSATAGLGLT